jgi:hypothetical protein
VDDEDDVRLSLERPYDTRRPTRAKCRFTRPLPFEIIGATDVPFDVVLTDMLMESPNSGVEVLKAALARDVLPKSSF